MIPLCNNCHHGSDLHQYPPRKHRSCTVRGCNCKDFVSVQPEFNQKELDEAAKTAQWLIDRADAITEKATVPTPIGTDIPHMHRYGPGETRQVQFCTYDNCRYPRVQGAEDGSEDIQEQRYDTKGHPLVEHVMLHGRPVPVFVVESVLSEVRAIVDDRAGWELAAGQLQEKLIDLLTRMNIPFPKREGMKMSFATQEAPLDDYVKEYVHTMSDALNKEMERVKMELDESDLDAATIYKDTRNAISAIESKHDPVNHPSHYTAYPGIEIIQLTRHMNFNRGNAVKYIARAGLKDKSTEVQDLEKAIWYLQDELKLLKGEYNID